MRVGWQDLIGMREWVNNKKIGEKAFIVGMG